MVWIFLSYCGKMGVLVFFSVQLFDLIEFKFRIFINVIHATYLCKNLK